MIVEFDAHGRIMHIINDPVPPHMTTFLMGEGRQFLDLPPIPWEPEPQFDENGEPMLDDEGRHVWASNGMDSQSCDILLDYVANGVIQPRPECPASVSVAGRIVTITDVPPGASVEVALEGASIQWDGDDRVELDEPGPVTVTITCPWPYLEGSYDLEIE